MISRENLMQLLVVVIVLAFVFEIFSYQGASRSLNSGSAPKESPTPAGGGEIGTAEAEAVVSSYPDNVITIEGYGAAGDSALIAKLRALESDGKVAYFNSANPDNVNAVLTASANITEIGWDLARDFPDYHLYAKAQLALPEEIEFATAEGVVSAPVRFRASVMMEPVVPEGSNVSVFITALLVKGAVSDMQVELAEKEATAPIMGRIAQLGDQWVANAEIAWENRTRINESALKDALSAVYPNSTVSYEMRPYISFGNVSEEKQAQLRNLSYVLLTVNGLAVVEDDFVNKSAAEEDFHRILGANASLAFPSSILKINVSSGSFNESAFREIVGLDGLRVWRAGAFEVGENISIGGRDYFLPGGARLLRFFPSNASVGDQLTQLARIRIKGGRVILIE